jgi:hypothetical protein
MSLGYSSVAKKQETHAGGKYQQRPEAVYYPYVMFYPADYPQREGNDEQYYQGI